MFVYDVGVKEAIYGQTISGLFFAIFGGPAMVVLLTTAPLAIYTKSKPRDDVIMPTSTWLLANMHHYS